MSQEQTSEALEKAIRNSLSPECVAALAMALQSAESMHTSTPEGEKAIEQLIGFRDTLLKMIGVKTYNRMMNELGF